MKSFMKNNAQAILTFSFDDGYKETYDSTIPCLADHGFRASYNIVTSLVGNTLGNLPTASWDDWQGAVSEGMEIASHSMTHGKIPVPMAQNLRIFLESFSHEQHKLSYLKHVARRMLSSSQQSKDYKAKMTLENIANEVNGSKAEIYAMLDHQVQSYVYPYGAYTQNYQDQVRAAGYVSARSLVRGFNRLAALDLFALKAMNWTRYTTVQSANEWIDAAIRNNAWLIEVYHLVGCNKPVNSSTDFTPIDDFKRHLDYVRILHDKGKLRVETQANIVKHIYHEDRG